MTSLEAVELLLGLSELLGRNLRLQDLFDKLPELLVLVIKQDDEAGGLRVETAGDVGDGVVDDLLDAGV